MSAASHTRRRTALWIAVLVAALLAAGGVWLLATAGDGGSTADEQGTTLQELAADPEAHAGRTVTVSGNVAATHGDPPALALGDEIDDQVLVLPDPAGEEPLETWPDPDDDVRITGEARVFRFDGDRARLSRAGDDQFFGPFEGGAMIVPSRIEIVDSGTTSPIRPE